MRIVTIFNLNIITLLSYLSTFSIKARKSFFIHNFSLTIKENITPSPQTTDKMWSSLEMKKLWILIYCTLYLGCCAWLHAAEFLVSLTSEKWIKAQEHILPLSPEHTRAGRGPHKAPRKAANFFSGFLSTQSHHNFKTFKII